MYAFGNWNWNNDTLVCLDTNYIVSTGVYSITYVSAEENNVYDYTGASKSIMSLSLNLRSIGEKYKVITISCKCTGPNTRYAIGTFTSSNLKFTLS